MNHVERFRAVMNALPVDRLVVGKFYELHAEVPQQGGEPVGEFSGLAILPVAKSKQFKPI